MEREKYFHLKMAEEALFQHLKSKSYLKLGPDLEFLLRMIVSWGVCITLRGKKTQHCRIPYGIALCFFPSISKA